MKTTTICGTTVHINDRVLIEADAKEFSGEIIALNHDNITIRNNRTHETRTLRVGTFALLFVVRNV